MISLAQILCAVPLPFLLGLLLAFVARDLAASTLGRRGLGAVVLAAVVVVAHAAVAAAAEAQLVWPRSGWHWAWWAALAMLPLYAIAAPPAADERVGLVARGWRWTLLAALGAGGVVLLLLPMVGGGRFLPLNGNDGTTLTRWGELAGLAGLAGLLTLGGGWALNRRPAGPVVEHVAAGIASALVAVGIGLAGTKDIALLAGIVPLAIAASGLLHLRGDRPWAGGALATMQLGAWHLVAAMTYAELHWWGALPLAIALPAGALAARLGRTPRAAAAWRLGVTAGIGLLAVAAILLWGQPPVTPADGPDYKY